MKRRNFFKTVLAGSSSMVAAPLLKGMPIECNEKAKPETNIGTAMSIPRTAYSLPGKYSGIVSQIICENSLVDGKPSEPVAYQMVKESLLQLTGENDLEKAWLQFVSPVDVIGLKVNPIGGTLLSTSHAVVRSIIQQLLEAGIPKSQIILWDRRQENLENAGFDSAGYPDIQILGTECYDEKKSYINDEGRFYSEDWIDKNHFYYADVEGEYDAYTLPYMVNGGKYSYFSKICTEKVTKIINIPVLKNAGASITGCLKNLAYGSITNTGRLHKDLWHETCAEVCAFPPLRDKVVLNILDGILGCFDGGPAANPQFICSYNTLLAGTDPVAIDRIAYDIVMKKRQDEGVQKEEKEGARTFMELAQSLQLGIANRENIDLRKKIL